MTAFSLPTVFESPPALAQFASNSCWEEALSFSPTQTPSPDTLRSYLQGRTELAFETFHGDHFLGIRCEDSPDAVLHFAVQCVRSFQWAQQGTAIHLALQETLGHTLFSTPPAFAEVGAVNAWRSVGSYRIELHGPAAIDTQALFAHLMQSPLGQHHQHPKALEFAFTHPVSHWVGTPVSTSEAGYPLSHTLLAQALHAWSKP
jgi:hypothetical protein